MESMQNNKRDVRVTIDINAIGKVLKDLKQEGDSITLVLKVEDTKETYKVLSRPEVFDWDFVEEKSNEEEDDCKNPKPYDTPRTYEDDGYDLKGDYTQEFQDLEKIGKDEEGSTFYFPDHTLVSNSSDLVKLIESVWRVAKEKPSIRFGTKLYEGEFRDTWNLISKEEHLKTDLTSSTTRAMMKLLIDVFYNTPEDEELVVAYYDTLERIKKNYNSLKSAETLNQVMNILYRHEN